MFYTWRRRILGVKKLGTTDNFPVQPLGRGFVVQIVEQCYVIVMRFTDFSYMLHYVYRGKGISYSEI